MGSWVICTKYASKQRSPLRTEEGRGNGPGQQVDMAQEIDEDGIEPVLLLYSVDLSSN